MRMRKLPCACWFSTVLSCGVARVLAIVLFLLLQLDYSDTTLSDRGLWVAASSSPRAGTEESFEKEDQRLLHDGLFWFGDPRIMLR